MNYSLAQAAPTYLPTVETGYSKPQGNIFSPRLQLCLKQAEPLHCLMRMHYIAATYLSKYDLLTADHCKFGFSRLYKKNHVLLETT